MFTLLAKAITNELPSVLQIFALYGFYHFSFTTIGYLLFESNGEISSNATSAYRTLFDWSWQCFLLTMRHRLVFFIEQQPNKTFAILYILGIVFLLSFTLLSLFVAVARSSYRHIVRNKIVPSSFSQDNKDVKLDMPDRISGEILRHRIYAFCINSCVILNIILMASKHRNQTQSWANVLDTSENLFLMIFFIDLLIQILAAENLWLFFCRSKGILWHYLDLIIVLSGFVEIVLEQVTSSTTINLSYLRVLRLLRLSKLLKHRPELLRIIYGIRKAGKQLGILLFLWFLVILVFAVVGILVLSCDKSFYFSFCSVPDAIITLFVSSTGNSIFTVVQVEENILYFVVYFFLSVFFLVNCFVVVLIDVLEKKQDMSLEMQNKQRQLLKTKFLNNFNSNTRSQETNMFETIVKSTAFNGLILCSIILGTLLLAMSSPAFESPSWFHDVDIVLTVVFALEASFKIKAFGFSLSRGGYLHDFSDRFDFFLLCIMMLELILKFMFKYKQSPIVSLLKNFRLLRPLRLLFMSDHLRNILHALKMSMVAVVDITLLLILFLFVYGIAALELYFDDIDFFSNILSSMAILFEILSLKAWTTKFEACLNSEKVPKIITILFFVSFIFISNFILLKIIIGLVVSYMRKASGSTLLSDDQILFNATQERIRKICYKKLYATLNGFILLQFCTLCIVIVFSFIPSFDIRKVCFIDIFGTTIYFKLYACNMKRYVIVLCFILSVTLGFLTFYLSLYQGLAIRVFLVVSPHSILNFIPDEKFKVLRLSVLTMKLSLSKFAGALLLFMFYIFLVSIVATHLFAVENERYLFTNRSFVLMLSIVAGENWIIIKNDISQVVLASLFYYTFYFLTFNVFLNLFVSVVIDEYSNQNRQLNAYLDNIKAITELINVIKRKICFRRNIDESRFVLEERDLEEALKYHTMIVPSSQLFLKDQIMRELNTAANIIQRNMPSKK